MNKLGNMLFVATLISAATALGAVNTYQVTGPVLDVKEGSVTIQKGKEKWEIARDSGTKVTGDLKVGGKATVEYRMAATSIEAKSDKTSSKKADKKKRSAE